MDPPHARRSGKNGEKVAQSQRIASKKEGQKVWDEHDISSGQTHEMMSLKEDIAA
jgi:hypothetical protein